MEKNIPIKQFFNDQGILCQWPSKKKKLEQQLVLEFLSKKFEEQKNYSEIEVNQLLNQLHNFQDPALLRREMVERKLLLRTKDCRAYWKNIIV